MTQAQLADTLAGCVNQQVNQAQHHRHARSPKLPRSIQEIV
jgi:hypothetical protein